jgi:hypothetical protein
MTEQITITVHPIAGVDFRMIPDGVAVTIRYYSKADNMTAEDVQFSSTVQTVTVGFTAAQAKELASSFERAATMIQTRPSDQSK